MKSICIFTNTLKSGGAEKQAVLLSKVLAKRYRVILLIYYGRQVETKFQNALEKSRVKIYYLDGSIINKVFHIYQVFRKENIDIVFSYLLTTNTLGSLIGRLARVEYTIGGIRNCKLDRKKETLQRLLHNHVNCKTIYNNYTGKKYLSTRGFDIDRAYVIPNGILVRDKFYKRKRNKKMKILTVGRFQPAKDYRTAILSIRELVRHNSNIHYTIIGYGSEESMVREWVSENSIEDHTDLIINPTNIEDYYLEADIYLLSSVYEGLSNTIMEAMNYSLPIVATDVGDNGRLVENGVNGYLCKPKDYKGIADRLQILVNSYEERLTFGSKSYQKLKDTYSLEKFEENYIDFIENLG